MDITLRIKFKVLIFSDDRDITEKKLRDKGLFMLITDYNDLLPEGLIFSLREIEEMKLIKVSTLKKMIQQGAIERVLILSKNFISRHVLIDYLQQNTIEARD